jgi:hypothetical protein
MKKIGKTFFYVVLISCLFAGCEKAENGDIDDGDDANNGNTDSGLYIAGYSTAKESVLRSVPQQYINAARNNLHVAYQHTSHGTHVSYGVFGLQDYKDGDDILFGITNNSPQSNKLDFRDCVLANYAAPGVDAADLSRDETAFIQATRNYLDDPGNAEINVIMWSWCNIGGHNVSGNYLPGMDSLISEYGVGGTKTGSNAGQRVNPVTFIFMTGHANSGSNVGTGCPKDQAELIINHCNDNNQFCLDYYSIDTHDMDNNYWEDAGDDGNSSEYASSIGNGSQMFYMDWQNEHILGTDYFENKVSPGGTASYGAHNSQHITANRKAYAMWWILARIAGWSGE